MTDAIIVALVGPTASGKTEAAMALADLYPVSLISMDSAMVYRGMDIGTAKPTPGQLEQYPHALIDIRDPFETYSVAQFVEDADAAVRQSVAEGRIPLLVGGTMLYLKAFREGIAPMPAADAGLRERLHGEADRRGTRALHERLQQIDPRAAARIHPNNFSRIQRALEVHELTGLPISEHWQKARGVRERLGAELLEFGIEPDTRAALHDRIEKRLDDMLSGGFIEEVEGLMRKDRMQVDLPSMRAVGYRQVWEHLEGLTTFAQMRDRALAATRQLAKRQITWMRSWPDLAQLARDAGGRLAEQIAVRSGLTR